MALQARQTTQQKLVMAPNVTLALEVLRMPTLELISFLSQQLEDNPCLEMEEPDTEAPAEPLSQPENGEAAGPQGDEEWLAHWRTAGEREDPEGNEDGEDRAMEQRLVVQQTLHESLMLQIGCQVLSSQMRRLGELLIQHLNEQGYLEFPLDELAAHAGTDPATLAQALALIQRLDPPGVGARDLRECLMLQLQHGGLTGTLAYRILEDHFPFFVQNRVESLAKALGASAQDTARACDELKRLNPKPGRMFAADLPPSVTPDLVLHHRERHYDVELNDEELPRIRVSREYQRMLKDPRTPDDAKEFIAVKVRRAHWLIKAIDERNATLLAIARCLISLQRDFIEQGPKALKPLTQAQVAALVGRHPSTVSRAICGKTIDTPFGIFRIEQFFASSVPQDDADAGISDSRIKDEIQRLISEEDPKRSLSDAALARRLAERHHINVARRTVAKYRSSLKILPAHLRRRRI
jgi:RNA polymerase sigma-54 factor